MLRTINLIAYIPPFMREYAEIAALLNAEDPELQAVWDATDGSLDETFISTADEYGIGRFERILGITPATTDTLDIRRQRVLAYWNSDTPYTWWTLQNFLTQMCGSGEYTCTLDNDEYTLNIVLSLSVKHILSDLVKILSSMIPANIVLTVSLDYNKWRDFTAKTWGELRTLTWNQMREDVIT